MRTRYWKIENGDLRSALSPGQLDAPHAIVGVVIRRDEEILRLVMRAYQLGQEDAKADMREVIGL